MNSIKLIIFTVTALFYSAITHAYTFSIDNFSVTSNGTTVWNDSFDDGIAPTTNADYLVNGIVGPETNGSLTLDNSSGTVPFTGPTGFEIERQRVLLKSQYLGISDTFSVTAIFDLVAPSEMLALYGITLIDGTGTPGDDNLNLWVRRGFDDSVKIQFVRSDFLADAVTLYDQTLLDLDNHDQVMLTLSRNNLENNLISASFAYGLGSVFDSTTTFANTTDIFHGETFTRAQFQAIVPAVPVPAAAWLFGSGLIGLIGVARRKRT